MAMIADTLAHPAFAGVAAGLFVNAVYTVAVPPLLSALVVAAVAALPVWTLVNYAGAYRDTSLAIVLTGAFAVGSVLITAADGGIASVSTPISSGVWRLFRASMPPCSPG